MNHEHPDTSTIRFPDHDSTLDSSERRGVNRLPSSLHQKGPHLSSTPSDADWVSPFTLPPLPALRRNRGQSGLLTSPEHLRQRAESGAYYAAAWGSPYATPSPGRSPAPARRVRRSFDTDSSSPTQFRTSAPTSSARPSRHSVDLSGLIPKESGYENRWKSLRRARSEKPNWLSDSDSGGEDRFLKEVEKTPTRNNLLVDRDQETTPRSVEEKAARNAHQINASVATITPNTFRRTNVTDIQPIAPSQDLSSRPRILAAMESETWSPEVEASATSAEKPLPTIPQSTSPSLESKGPAEPISPTRPRPTSIQSYQRPKKKVAWKGKSCIIALPLTDREEAGLPPLLTPQEVRKRLDGWVAAGYSIKGFGLDNLSNGSSIRGSGQSRPTFPDPIDVQSERQMRLFAVHIPNKAEWDAWVNYLQEEKLRALGVTPSSSEAAPSSQSPFSAPLSRSSSRFPGLVPSPPVAPSSSASNHLPAKSRSFSPSFMAATGKSPQNGSMTSPQFGGMMGALHGYKSSIVPSMLQPRLTSPYDYPISQPSSLGPGARSPAQSNLSPINIGNMQSLGAVLSPMSPVSGPENGISAYPNALNDNARRHQQDLQAHMARQQQAQHTQRSPPIESQKSDSLPKNPEYQPISRPPLEIAHPTPRSHRHNLSMALQRDIDAAEAELEKANRGRPEEHKHNEEIVKVINPDDEASENVMHEDLPILKRPETISRNDDRSEIETNPSIAASPMLMDDKNPLDNWQALSEAAKGEQRPAHKSKLSASKFNVQAREFDPRAGFSSSNFSFGDNSFQAFALPQQSSSNTTGKLTGPEKSSQSRFNVEAPAFTPGKPGLSLEESISKFSSPTFNVEAPEFNPTRSPASNFMNATGVEAKDFSSTSSSLFGEVVIDPQYKGSRRSVKALAITRPRSREASPNSEEPVGDEDGRPTLPSERLKRARRTGGDGDDSPMFAKSAPFNHARILSEIVDDAEAHGSVSEEPPKKPVDGWAYIPAEAVDERQKGYTDEPVGRNGDRILSEREHSPFIFKNEQDAVRFSESQPRSVSDIERAMEKKFLISESDQKQEELSRDESSVSSAASEVEEPSQAPKTSLSAAAKPFEFKASAQPSITEERALEPRKASGLLASRFAKSPSPPLSSAIHVEKSVSPEPPLYQYIKAEDEPFFGEVDTLDNSEQTRSLPDDDKVENRPYEAAWSEGEQARKPDSETEAARSVLSNHGDDAMPSFEEIDAVMKQFESNPELGIERNDTPVQSTPLVDMRLAPNFRSDAPSPSPRRAQQNLGTISGESSVAAFGLGIGVRKITNGKEEVSDWNDELSTTEEDKLQSRTQFFDGHVNHIVGGILEHRLGPLERSLQSIQQSLELITNRPRSKTGRRSMSTDVKESDADDEDDYDAFEGFSSYRARSPMSKRERRPDRIKALVQEGMAAFHHNYVPEVNPVDMTVVHQAFGEIQQMVQNAITQDRQPDLKATLEDVISQHPRLRGSRVQQDHEAGGAKSKLQIDGLESMLKVANERAEEESKLRRQAEDEITELRYRLTNAEGEAAEHRESSETAQQSLMAFLEEKEAYKNLEKDVDELQLKNAALETTLEEYRASSDQWRDDIREERAKTAALTRTLRDLGDQLEDQSQSRRNMRAKVERLHEQIAHAVQDLNTEQAERRMKEHDLLSKNSLVQESLEYEIRRREKCEMELDTLSKRYQEALHFKSSLELTQHETSRLQQMVASLTDEKNAHQDELTRVKKELAETYENGDNNVSMAAVHVQAELEGIKLQSESLKSDYEVQISRLKRRLDDSEMDLEVQKTKHDGLLAETIDAHAQALREANEKRESALEEQHATHERKLNDLRDRHTRALHNSSDDKHRLEHHLTEKLALSEDKINHLEDKLTDLEERLEITKSAARAAVEAATSKGANLPTPAQSVVASPPQRATSASLAFMKGSEIPEKISPQALRESIMVLQDQLQNREQQIEKLEADLAAIDKEAPNKLKERDTEVTWLRELLAVRVDDLEELIATLSQPKFDREATKDAAIRLRANLQMEQQLKERAAAGLLGSFPSISTLSSYAQSPRALPMAAAAAWGNWRKARDTSIGALSDLATNLGNQTPSKSTIGSPASFLSGIITPPSTTQRIPTSTDAPPSMRPLAAAAAARKGSSSEARPLRAYNAQPRALSSRQQDKRPGSSGSSSHYHHQNRPSSALKGYRRSESPHTPTSSTRASLDLAADVDDDASPLDGRDEKSFREQHEQVEDEDAEEGDSVLREELPMQVS